MISTHQQGVKTYWLAQSQVNVSQVYMYTDCCFSELTIAL